MFAELPKLFDRDFAYAYFLPFALFIGATIGICAESGLMPSMVEIVMRDLVLGTTVIGLVSWLGGIGLLVTNRELIRTLEGYGRLNPVRLLARFEKQRFERKMAELNDLDSEYTAFSSRGQDIPQEILSRRNQVVRDLAEEFPDRADLLLPTKFGNAVRAFEIYPRLMYGIDSIPGWTRLLTVVPKDYRELVDGAKSQMDFWLNVGFLSLLFLIEATSVIVYTGRFQVTWVLLTALVLALLASQRAHSAAIGWGDFVKATFDIYLHELYAKLGTVPPVNRDGEIQFWKQFSQAMIYRLPNSLPEFKRPRLRD